MRRWPCQTSWETAQLVGPPLVGDQSRPPLPLTNSPISVATIKTSGSSGWTAKSYIGTFNAPSSLRIGRFSQAWPLFRVRQRLSGA